MRYVIVIVGFALFLIWDGFFNEGRYIDAAIRTLNHAVRFVTG